MATLCAKVVAQLDRVATRDGITRQELARRLGVDPSRVTRMLDDESNLQLDTLERLATALGVVVDVRLRRAS